MSTGLHNKGYRPGAKIRGFRLLGLVKLSNAVVLCAALQLLWSLPQSWTLYRLGTWWQ